MGTIATRRTCLAGIAATALVAGRAGAATYPTRPVRIVVPFAAGGVADITARIVAEKLSGRIPGGRFVIENMPGAGGVAAARNVVASDPDGHTLALLTNGTAVSVGLFNKLPFDPLADFVPVSTLGTFDFLFAVNRASGIDSMATLLRRAADKPGSLNVATVSVGSTQHLTFVLFNSLAGKHFVHVPYRGTPDALTSLLRGDVQVVIDSQAALRPGLESGDVRAIAASGGRRSGVLPDVPTAAEGGIPGFDVTSWNALFAPKGTPPAAVATLNDAVRDVLQTPEVKARLLELGIEATPEAPDALRERLRADIERWRAVIDTAGIPKQ